MSNKKIIDISNEKHENWNTPRAKLQQLIENNTKALGLLFLSDIEKENNLTQSTFFQMAQIAADIIAKKESLQTFDPKL